MEEDIKRGRWPQRWVCFLFGHQWARWIDNGGRRPCERCWKRIQVR